MLVSKVCDCGKLIFKSDLHHQAFSQVVAVHPPPPRDVERCQDSRCTLAVKSLWAAPPGGLKCIPNYVNGRAGHKLVEIRWRHPGQNRSSAKLNWKVGRNWAESFAMCDAGGWNNYCHGCERKVIITIIALSSSAGKSINLHNHCAKGQLMPL